VVWIVVETVWGTVAVVLATVVVAVVTVALAVALVEALDVEVWLAVVAALSGGTGTPAPRCVTDTVAEVLELPDASEPVVACDDVDLTAVPTPKPIARAASRAAPSSHQRRRTDAARAAVSSPCLSGAVPRSISVIPFPVPLGIVHGVGGGGPDGMSPPLNTDAYEHPGWLAPMLETIRQPGVGAVSLAICTQTGLCKAPARCSLATAPRRATATAATPRNSAPYLTKAGIAPARSG
jgi:hypothetical protein